MNKQVNNPKPERPLGHILSEGYDLGDIVPTMRTGASVLVMTLAVLQYMSVYGDSVQSAIQATQVITSAMFLALVAIWLKN